LGLVVVGRPGWTSAFYVVGGQGKVTTLAVQNSWLATPIHSLYGWCGEKDVAFSKSASMMMMMMNDAMIVGLEPPIVDFNWYCRCDGEEVQRAMMIGTCCCWRTGMDRRFLCCWRTRQSDHTGHPKFLVGNTDPFIVWLVWGKKMSHSPSQRSIDRRSYVPHQSSDFHLLGKKNKDEGCYVPVQ
jgi:hypothetical protein